MQITDEYLRGLVDGEGCFTFCSTQVGGQQAKHLIPTFILTMNERDKELVEAVRDHLGLKNKVYHLGPYRKDGHNRGPIVRLMVRDVGSIKNIIIPLFYRKLKGFKGSQFDEWLNRIGTDELVPTRYKIVYRLYKLGFYDKRI